MKQFKSEYIRSMPVWTWVGFIDFHFNGEDYEKQIYIHYTQDGYQHSYGNNSVPVRIEIFDHQDQRVTVDIFGFSVTENIQDFMNIPQGILALSY